MVSIEIVLGIAALLASAAGAVWVLAQTITSQMSSLRTELLAKIDHVLNITSQLTENRAAADQLHVRIMEKLEDVFETVEDHEARIREMEKRYK